MHDAAGLGQQGMKPAVQRPGGEVRGVRLFHGGVILGVEEQELGGFHLGKMPPARIHQELLAVVRNGLAEMIGHGLVPVIARRQPKSRRKVNTQLPFV